MNDLAPVALFVYNRPWHTKQTVEALEKNQLADQTELFIFSDAPKNENAIESVNEVRQYLKTINKFKKIVVIEREKNWGLANSIINGVTEIINKYGKIIVLEDDLVTSELFLVYMNLALSKYKTNTKIFSITAFNFNKNFLTMPKDYNQNIYAHPRPMSWGWAIWRERWEKCNWNIENYDSLINDNSFIKGFKKVGPDLPKMLDMQMNKKIDSWYIRFCYNSYKTKTLTIYPIKSLISNIGHDGTGVHCSTDESHKYINLLDKTDITIDENYFPNLITLNNNIVHDFNKNFIPKNIFFRIYNKITNKLKII